MGRMHVSVIVGHASGGLCQTTTTYHHEMISDIREAIPMMAFRRSLAGIETGCGTNGSVDRKAAYARYKVVKVSPTASVVVDTATHSIVAEIYHP